jgi:hypothetical protein
MDPRRLSRPVLTRGCIRRTMIADIQIIWSVVRLKIILVGFSVAEWIAIVLFGRRFIKSNGPQHLRG